MVCKCLTHCLAFGQHTPISSSLGGVPTFTSFSVSQSLSPQDRAAYKEYISNVSVGAGWCWGKGGFGGPLSGTPGFSLRLCSPSLQKRKSMTKLRGPNPKSSRTALQSKSVRSSSKMEGGVLGAWRSVAQTTDMPLPLPGV